MIYSIHARRRGRVRPSPTPPPEAEPDAVAREAVALCLNCPLPKCRAGGENDPLCPYHQRYKNRVFPYVGSDAVGVEGDSADYHLNLTIEKDL